MPIPAIIAIAGLALQVGSALMANSANKRSQKYAAGAADVRLQQQGMANAITRRDSIRTFRITRAQQLAAGTSEGNVQSSAVIGAMASSGSQEASNLQYFRDQSALDKTYNDYAKQAGISTATASAWNTVSQLSPQITQMAGSVYGSVTASKTVSTGQATSKPIGS